MPRTSQKTSSVLEIVQTLETQIIQGSLKPKEPLVESSICGRFGVSRTPVREAMRMLESRGYLIFTPYKGWTVKEISIAEVQEVYVVRAHLASLAAELACANLRERDLQELDGMLADMAVVVQKGDVHEYFELNINFHTLIEGVSGNRPLVRIMESLDKMTLRYRFLSLSLSGRLERSLDEHSRMVQAFRERDPEAAAQIAKESALNSGKLLMEYFGKPHPSMEPLVF